MRPAFERLRIEWGDAMRVQYKMGGLLPSWKHFQDAAHSINRPSQMGPEWLHAADLSGVAIDSRVWVNDPPASSYPACIAVKCVQLQAQDFAGTYLYLLNKALMEEGKNIPKTDELLEAAWLLRDGYSHFDLSRFRDDLMGAAGKEAFRKDLVDAKYLGINRFPTLVIKRKDRPTTMLTGYQTYVSLRAGFGDPY